MNTQAIANQLVAFCKQGQTKEAKSLYADDAVSVEAGGPPGASREAVGLDAIEQKETWWFENHEVHSLTVTGPWPHGDRFVVGFQIDVTPKSTGQRMQMDEMGLYTVKDGKIVREEFFYTMDA